MNEGSKYNPQIHHRRTIRLQGYDYSQAGLYFITICNNKHEHRFGHIVGAGLAPAQNNMNGAPAQNNANGAEMILNDYGQIANDEWLDLSNRFVNIELGEFVIMPNHMHGIISIKNVGAGFTPAQNNTNVSPAHLGGTIHSDTGAGVNPALTIGDIVGAYKSLVANKCLEMHLQKSNGIGLVMGKIWQRNYFEHIIRDEESHRKISEYIINNPANWLSDKFYN